jgi:hypothetical protein
MRAPARCASRLPTIRPGRSTRGPVWKPFCTPDSFWRWSSRMADAWQHRHDLPAHLADGAPPVQRVRSAVAAVLRRGRLCRGQSGRAAVAIAATRYQQAGDPRRVTVVRRLAPLQTEPSSGRHLPRPPLKRADTAAASAETPPSGSPPAASPRRLAGRTGPPRRRRPSSA